MKTIPLQLQDRLSRPTGSWCYCAKVVSAKDGAVYGFTTLDTDITFSDDIHTVTYSAENELRPQNIQHTSDFEADNTSFLGWFNTALEKLILAGRFDRAELTLYRVAYLHLEAGLELVAYGTVGEIDFSPNAKSKRKIEYIGLRGQLQQVVNEMYSLTCRAQFGDERCKKPLIWQAGQVSAVGDSPYLDFTVALAGAGQAAGYFDFGVIEFVTGDNAGAILEVEAWAANGTTHLSFLAPYPVKVGDMLRIRQDCGKTETDCLAYNNIANMRAEHLTPVEDAGVMVPGAYIKSVSSR